MGLTPNAAAGVAGNIYQESHGNPGATSGAGGGLFGETLANGGAVSGGSLSEQLSALLAYINANGSVADINANASSPTAAAEYFEEKYERAGIPDMTNRVEAAEWVAASAESGNWGSGITVTDATTSASTDSSILGGLLGIPSQITQFFSDADTLVNALMWLVKPSSWIRIGAFLVGCALLLLAAHALLAVGEGGNLLPNTPTVMPVPV